MSLVSHEGVRLLRRFPNWPTSRGTPPVSSERHPAHAPGPKSLRPAVEWASARGRAGSRMFGAAPPAGRTGPSPPPTGRLPGLARRFAEHPSIVGREPAEVEETPPDRHRPDRVLAIGTEEVVPGRVEPQDVSVCPE